MKTERQKDRNLNKNKKYHKYVVYVLNFLYYWLALLIPTINIWTSGMKQFKKQTTNIQCLNISFETRRLLIFIYSHLSYPKLMLLIWYSFYTIFFGYQRERENRNLCQKCVNIMSNLLNDVHYTQKVITYYFEFNVYTLHIISFVFFSFIFYSHKLTIRLEK